MTKVAEESIVNIRTVKAFANEDKENQRFGEVNQATKDLGCRFKNFVYTL